MTLLQPSRSLAVLLVFAGLLSCQGLQAADWSIVPAVELRTEFDSNINYSYRSRLKDYILSLRPGADFNYATESALLQGRVGLKGFHFISNSNLDTVDQNYQINGRYQFTPRLGLGLKASYISDTTMEEEYLASGLTLGRTTRTSYGVTPNLFVGVSEKLITSLGYDFNRVNYESPHYRNYLTHTVNWSNEYQCANQKTTLSSTLLVRDTTYVANNDNYRSLGTYVGLTHKFSDTWQVTAIGGMNFTWTKYRTVVYGVSYFPVTVIIPGLPPIVVDYPLLIRLQKVQKESAVTPYFDLRTVKRWDRGSVSAGFMRDQSASGYGTLYQFSRANASVTYRYTERMSVTLGGYYYHSNRAVQRGGSKETSLNLTPTLSYQLTEKFTLTSGYTFGWRENEVSDKTTHRHNVWLSLNYTYPWHFHR